MNTVKVHGNANRYLKPPQAQIHEITVHHGIGRIILKFECGAIFGREANTIEIDLSNYDSERLIGALMKFGKVYK